jgi:opacity protein-like surface antigen
MLFLVNLIRAIARYYDCDSTTRSLSKTCTRENPRSATLSFKGAIVSSEYRSGIIWWTVRLYPGVIVTNSVMVLGGGGSAVTVIKVVGVAV